MSAVCPMESQTQSRGESEAAEDPGWVPDTPNWWGSSQSPLMLALGEPTEASVLMYAFPHTYTAYAKLQWSVKGGSDLNTGPTIITVSSRRGNVTSCRQLLSACLPYNKWLYPPFVSPNNPFFFQLLLVRLSGHSNQKSSFYREPCAGHPSPGGKLTFKSSFHSTRNGSIHVYGGVRSCTVSWVALGRRRGQAGTGGVGFLLRLWAERTTASQSLISPPFPDPGHPPAPFFISVYLLRDPDSGKKAHFLPVCRTIAREACS